MTFALPEHPDPYPDATGPDVDTVPAFFPVQAKLPAVAAPVLRQPDARYLAHDARNWLTVLQVYCDLLRSSGAIASGYEVWMEELSSAVERGQVLVASLADSVERASPAASGRWRENDPAMPEASFCNPADAIARRLPIFRYLAGDAIQVEFDAVEFDAADPAGCVAMPESELERILQNLVTNAIEAMPHGGRLRIELKHGSRTRTRETEQAASRPLQLCICDTGKGIARQRLSHIFEDGVSGKAEAIAGSQPHGYGLAIVRELAERAGGTVGVRSQRGRGSCFEVELPCMETGGMELRKRTKIPLLTISKGLRKTGNRNSKWPGNRKGIRGIC